MAAKKSSKKTAKKSSKASPKLVKMKRGETTADVHPDEVKNYEKGGWEKAS